MSIIDEIEARHAAASPGPWSCQHPSDMRRTPVPSSSLIHPKDGGFPVAKCRGSNFGDADFIAASWQDVRTLLDEVTRLRVAVQALETGV